MVHPAGGSQNRTHVRGVRSSHMFQQRTPHKFGRQRLYESQRQMVKAKVASVKRGDNRLASTGLHQFAVLTRSTSTPSRLSAICTLSGPTR
jgi:hypothetical protein